MAVPRKNKEDIKDPPRLTRAAAKKMSRVHTEISSEDYFPVAQRGILDTAAPSVQINLQGSSTTHEGKERMSFSRRQLNKNVSRVSSIDWLPEFARDAADDVPCDEVFKDVTQPSDNVPIFPGKEGVPDSIFEYFEYLNRNPTSLLPVEPNEDFLNKKKVSGKHLIPSDDWIHEYESQKLHALSAVQGGIEAPVEKYATETSSCALDESSVQSSVSSAVSSRGKQNAKVDYCIPTDEDVLLGRGGLTNHHKGNKRYRKEADKLKPKYTRSSKREKFEVSQHLVKIIESLGGRFLIEDKHKKGRWLEATKDKARKKASQALREHRRRSSTDDDSV